MHAQGGIIGAETAGLLLGQMLHLLPAFAA
jgi:hypothetical protein